MGFRERVALLGIVLFIGATLVKCMPQKSSERLIRRTGKHFVPVALTNQGPPSCDTTKIKKNLMTKIFNSAVQKYKEKHKFSEQTLKENIVPGEKDYYIDFPEIQYPQSSSDVWKNLYPHTTFVSENSKDISEGNHFPTVEYPVSLPSEKEYSWGPFYSKNNDVPSCGPFTRLSSTSNAATNTWNSEKSAKFISFCHGIGEQIKNKQKSTEMSKNASPPSKSTENVASSELSTNENILNTKTASKNSAPVSSATSSPALLPNVVSTSDLDEPSQLPVDNKLPSIPADNSPISTSTNLLPALNPQLSQPETPLTDTPSQTQVLKPMGNILQSDTSLNDITEKSLDLAPTLISDKLPLRNNSLLPSHDMSPTPSLGNSPIMLIMPVSIFGTGFPQIINSSPETLRNNAEDSHLISENSFNFPPDESPKNFEPNNTPLTNYILPTLFNVPSNDAITTPDDNLSRTINEQTSASDISPPSEVTPILNSQMLTPLYESTQLSNSEPVFIDKKQLASLENSPVATSNKGSPPENSPVTLMNNNPGPAETNMLLPDSKTQSVSLFSESSPLPLTNDISKPMILENCPDMTTYSGQDNPLPRIDNMAPTLQEHTTHSGSEKITNTTEYDPISQANDNLLAPLKTDQPYNNPIADNQNPEPPEYSQLPQAEPVVPSTSDRRSDNRPLLTTYCNPEPLSDNTLLIQNNTEPLPPLNSSTPSDSFSVPPILNSPGPNLENISQPLLDNNSKKPLVNNLPPTTTIVLLTQKTPLLNQNSDTTSVTVIDNPEDSFTNQSESPQTQQTNNLAPLNTLPLPTDSTPYPTENNLLSNNGPLAQSPPVNNLPPLDNNPLPPVQSLPSQLNPPLSYGNKQLSMSNHLPSSSDTSLTTEVPDQNQQTISNTPLRPLESTSLSSADKTFILNNNRSPFPSEQSLETPLPAINNGIVNEGSPFISASGTHTPVTDNSLPPIENNENILPDSGLPPLTFNEALPMAIPESLTKYPNNMESTYPNNNFTKNTFESSSRNLKERPLLHIQNSLQSKNLSDLQTQPTTYFPLTLFGDNKTASFTEVTQNSLPNLPNYMWIAVPTSDSSSSTSIVPLILIQNNQPTLTTIKSEIDPKDQDSDISPQEHISNSTKAEISNNDQTNPQNTSEQNNNAQNHTVDTNKLETPFDEHKVILETQETPNNAKPTLIYILPKSKVNDNSLKGDSPKEVNVGEPTKVENYTLAEIQTSNNDSTPLFQDKYTLLTKNSDISPQEHISNSTKAEISNNDQTNPQNTSEQNNNAQNSTLAEIQTSNNNSTPLFQDNPTLLTKTADNNTNTETSQNLILTNKNESDQSSHNDQVSSQSHNDTNHHDHNSDDQYKTIVIKIIRRPNNTTEEEHSGPDDDVTYKTENLVIHIIDNLKNDSQSEVEVVA